ncbi:MAG TPA: YciI family protein [Aliidongia sp.]|uniref:YciI family protein n=1 Tax=Aliidongia sp. TaxID=1914230 RepID=UPI002DDCB048|nr:YciI family protein [Aliidongia sp.]HEV2675288.1 YciI family protein [Aliidongia sp.]
MFAVILSYLRPIEEVNEALADHRVFLADFYAAGFGIASGRQVGTPGGVIIAVAPSRAALDAELAKDPFHVRGLARYDVYEFTPTTTHPALKGVVN